MAVYQGPKCRLKVIRHVEAGRLLPDDLVWLEAENGAGFAWPLAAAGFVAGDVIEVRRVSERAGESPVS